MQVTTQEERSLEAHGLYRFGLAYGRQMYRLRWLIIAFWVVALAVSIPFAIKLPSILSGGGYSFSGSESVRVSNQVTNLLKQPPSQAMVVFQSAHTPVNNAAYQKEINDFSSRAHSFPHVTSVVPGSVGKDGRTTFVIVSFDKGSDVMESHMRDFHKLLPSGTAAGPASAYLTGGPAISQEFTAISQSDVERAELLALPIALLVLLVVFGTLVAAATPLLLAMVSVPVALAIIYSIAVHSSTSVFVLNVASIVGLGISIDYSLFLTRRFREELALGRTVVEAVSRTVATAGEAILFSGMTVMIGFCGLLLIGVEFMTSFGIGGAAVVGVSVLAALTLLPALLSALGPRINALRIPFLGRLTSPTKSDREDIKKQRGFWQTWALAVMHRPVLFVLLVSALLIGLGWPIFSMNIGAPTATSLPKSAEARQGLDILNAQIPETNENAIYIIAQTPDKSGILTPGNIAKVASLSQWLAVQPHVTGVTSLTHFPTVKGAPAPTEQQLATLYSTGAYQRNPALAQLVSSTTANDFTLITVKSNATMDSPESKALIDSLRANYKPAAHGLTMGVGGTQAVSLDFNRYLYGNFPRAIIFILVATYILLLLMFRSLLLPLKAVLMNVLSVSATYGVLVFVFQWGNFSTILGFTASGTIDSIVPILLFCILFGLSMDYEVFLLSRIREEWYHTHDNRRAVARGLEMTGGVITNAALLFIIVTGAFTFTSLAITKQVGLGMTVAILVDATIIRTLLVPATMRLLGRWNWWLPGRPLPPKQVKRV